MKLKCYHGNRDGFSIVALIAAAAVVLLVLAAASYLLVGRRTEIRTGSEESPSSTETNELAPSGSSGHAVIAPRRTFSSPVAPPPAVATEIQPDANSRELVSALVNVDGRKMTAEQIASWKRNLQSLVEQGARSVPAIAEFLEKNQDIDFGPKGRSTLGQPSARRALFDALSQIGGAEASEVLVRTLKDSADPKEIAALAGHLGQLSLDEHRGEILQAARDVLGMAGNGGLPPDTDVGPVFEVLQKYGDQSVIGDLEKDSSRWKYYSAMALANLPDGAGVPSLVKMAAEDGGNKITALQMLGAFAHQYPDAKSALIEQARQNKIPANVWPYLIDGLAGREFGFVSSESDAARAALAGSDLKSTSIKFGNQNYYSAPNPATLTPEFIQEKNSVINELKTATSDPAALAALNQAQNELNARVLPKQVSSSSANP